MHCVANIAVSHHPMGSTASSLWVMQPADYGSRLWQILQAILGLATRLHAWVSPKGYSISTL